MSIAQINALRYNLEAVQETLHSFPSCLETTKLFEELATFIRHFKCADQLGIDLIDLTATVDGVMLDTVVTYLFSEMSKSNQLSFLTSTSEDYTLKDWLGDWDVDDVLEWVNERTPTSSILESVNKEQLLTFIQQRFDISEVLDNYNSSEMAAVGWFPNKQNSLPKPRVRLHVDGSIEIMSLIIPSESVEVMTDDVKTF